MSSARIRHAIIFSDVHLGWIPLAAHHERLIRHLGALVEDAELVILNGDILDRYRGLPSSEVRALVAQLTELVAGWRGQGRAVVYIEGNHDPQAGATGPLSPDRWCHDFEGARGERIRVLHGHKVAAPDAPLGPYERYGRHVLRWENGAYARSALLRRVYPATIGWLVGAVGLTEDRLWRPPFYRAVRSSLATVAIDALVHGHFHFGPGQLKLGPITLHRSGAWVSPGHRGSVDRVLRYLDGSFQRLELRGSRWRPAEDGR